MRLEHRRHGQLVSIYGTQLGPLGAGFGRSTKGVGWREASTPRFRAEPDHAGEQYTGNEDAAGHGGSKPHASILKCTDKCRRH